MAKILIKRSDVSGYVPTLAELNTGELQLNTFDGKLYVKRDTLVDAEIVELGVTAQTAERLATSRTINGVGFDGTQDITFGTSSVPEQLNLYFTQARFDSAFAIKSTDDLIEGTNLYFTNARASAASPIQSVAGRTGIVTLSATDITGVLPLIGGTMAGPLSLYANPTVPFHAATKFYVDSQVTSGTSSSANKLTTPRLINGTAFDGTVDISFPTTQVSEGTNLYFTNSRARQAISVTGSLNYNNSTGVISYTAPSAGAGAGDFKADGSVSMTGTFKGLDVQVTGAIQQGYVYHSSVKATAIAQTTAYQVFAFPVANKAVKLFIKVHETTTNNLHLVEMLVLNDGTTVTHNEYGLLTSNGQLCTFDFLIQAGGVVLTMTPFSAQNKEITVACTALIN